MFDITFEFESFTINECENEIIEYLKQHINQDRYQVLLKVKKDNPENIIYFSLPETTVIIFGNSYKKNSEKITRSLKTNKTIYDSLGLLSFDPDDTVKEVCKDLYDSKYMVPTIRVIDPKVLFYLLIQFDTGFLRWITTKEEYNWLAKEFNSPYPVFSTANRLAELSVFSGALV